MEVVSGIARRALEVIAAAADNALDLGLPPVLFSSVTASTAVVADGHTEQAAAGRYGTEGVNNTMHAER